MRVRVRSGECRGVAPGLRPGTGWVTAACRAVSGATPAAAGLLGGAAVCRMALLPPAAPLLLPLAGCGRLRGS